MATVAFWYDFASTYSYLTAMRIEDAAAAAGIGIRWRPFLLGPIFAGQGWNTSPFNLYPAKGRYMWRDVERLARARGLPLYKPDLFPQNGITAARIALAGEAEGWVGEFTRRVYRAEFAEGRDIARPETLIPILTDLGLDGPALIARARGDERLKARLKLETDTAVRHGIFGSPSLVTEDGELFWGDDRVEQALDWARFGRQMASRHADASPG